MKKYLLSLALFSLFACGSPQASTSGGGSTGTTTATGTTSSTGAQKTDEEYRQEAVKGMHDALLSDIQAMRKAVDAICDSLPAPPNGGWDAKADAAAVDKSRKGWVEARTAYERIEGALAPLFPDLDFSIDGRYDDFLTQLQAQGGDSYLFDSSGVTGMHSIERILYSDGIPQRVIDFEKTLPGYVPAAFPSSPAEAADMKAELCARLQSDTKTMEEQWTPANINVAVAFQGLIALVREQREKVQKASSFEEESRYSQRTMADLRANLAGSKIVYALFQPWIVSKIDATDPKKDGPTIDKKILAGFDKLEAAYAKVQGDAIPQPPATWSAENPSADDLKTPFGQLFQSVESAVDSADDESIAAQMSDAAKALGFPEFNGQ